MGVRLELFALDLPRFTAFIRQPVWEWLWYYADNGTAQGGDVLMPANDDAHIVYVATPRLGVMRAVGNKSVALDRRNRPGDPLLSDTLHDYLASNSPWRLQDLLTAVGRCPPNDCVRLVTSGHRRWWIGSLLDYAEKTLGPAAPDYLFLASLFRKLLGWYDCGKVLPAPAVVESEPRFPLRLQEDPDIHTGVWRDEETFLVMDILRSMMSEHTRFSKPPLPVGVAPEKEEDWNDWVHQMIAHILSIDAFPPAMRSVVSFIC
jgi:hypothetical protein